MLPSICGVIVAERRDLIVAVYSSLRGTGELLIVTVCTGVAGGAPAVALAAGLLQPLTTSDSHRTAPPAKSRRAIDESPSSPRLSRSRLSPCTNPLIFKL
jgi:hypothetical protein